MESTFDQLLAEIPDCSWAGSGQYFEDVKILHEIGFTGVMDTDTFVETSFATNGRFRLSGARIKTFNNDNIQHEDFVVYCISLPILASAGLVKIRLGHSSIWSMDTIKGFIYGMPIIALIVFNILTLILPAPLSTALFYLSLAAIIIVIVMYLYNGIPLIMNLVREKKYLMDGKTITYQVDEDTNILKPRHIKALEPLTQQKIDTVVIFKDRIFFKQPVDPALNVSTIKYLSSGNFQNLF